MIMMAIKEALADNLCLIISSMLCCVYIPRILYNRKIILIIAEIINSPSYL